ncbi:MAG TPA: hypothetical protein VFA05_06305 [Gaiellaceae bacterium]|nr:hypothetical protein [Gaiellaceae bacterium]
MSVRAALAACVAAGGVAAVALGAPGTWRELHRGPRLTAAQAATAAAAHEGLPVALFARWKAELRPGERWWLVVAPGVRRGLTTRGAEYQTYALYALLPNLPARSERAAGVVFRVERP